VLRVCGDGHTVLNVAVIVAALHLLAPQMSRGTREMYANVLRKEGAAYHVDPLLVASLVQHESRWRQNADNGQCVGLGQVCLRTQAACATGLATPECQARRRQLLDGPTNLHVVAGMLAGWTKKCKEWTGHAAPRYVVAGYAGVDGHGVRCGQVRKGGVWHQVKMRKAVREIMTIYKQVQKSK